MNVLNEALRGLGIDPDSLACQRMAEHYRLLVEANRRFNLTRITDPAAAAVRHYGDCLALLAWPHRGLPDGLRVLDVGTGAGFPAVPLAIARPGWQVTAVDGTAKKAAFVADCASRLGLTNLHALHLRGEALPHDAGGLDLVCFRAVGRLADCFRLARPLLAPGAAVICWKAARIAPPEFEGAVRAAGRLGMSRPRCWPYPLAGLAIPRRHQLVSVERTE